MIAMDTNEIEVIDLDCPEQEVPKLPILKPKPGNVDLPFQRNTEIVNNVTSTSQNSLPTANISFCKLTSSILGQEKQRDKTVALIPIDYFKLLNVNKEVNSSGSYQGSKVYLCQVPLQANGNVQLGGVSLNIPQLLRRANLTPHIKDIPELVDTVPQYTVLRNPPPLKKITSFHEMNNDSNAVPLNKDNKRMPKTKKCQDCQMPQLSKIHGPTINAMKNMRKPMNERVYSATERDPLDISHDHTQNPYSEDIESSNCIRKNIILKPFRREERIPNLIKLTSKEKRIEPVIDKLIDYADRRENLNDDSDINNIPDMSIFEPLITLSEFSEEHLPFGNQIQDREDGNNTKRSGKRKWAPQKTQNLTIRKDKVNTQNKTISNLHERKITENPKSPIQQSSLQTTPDRCRNLFMKSSAWIKLDPLGESCKGFNDREKEISRICFENFSKYLDQATKEAKNLINLIHYEAEVSNNEELYFTKKIEIMDTRGRKIKTQYLNEVGRNPRSIREIFNSYYVDPRYIKRKSGSDKTKNKKQKLEGTSECKVIKTKPCHVVIQRNELVEKEVKRFQERLKIKTILDSKFADVKDLKRESFKPMLILNKNNISLVRLDYLTCTKSNVVFVKKSNQAFPEKLYRDDNFVKLVSKNLIKITSPKVLQSYFAHKAVTLEL